MLSVIIQPDHFCDSYDIEDVSRIIVLKFSHKQMFENDYSYDIIYDSDKIDKDIFNIICSNINKNNVVTYNGSLLMNLIEAINSDPTMFTEDVYRHNVIDLMNVFSSIHSPKNKWYKLVNALKYYDYETNVDIYDPMDVAEKTLILYRLMKNHDDI